MRSLPELPSVNRLVTVNIDELRKELDGLPPVPKPGARAVVWTDELDEILLQYWGKKDQRDIARIIGVSVGIARMRWRLLQEKYRPSGPGKGE